MIAPSSPRGSITMSNLAWSPQTKIVQMSSGRIACPELQCTESKRFLRVAASSSSTALNDACPGENNKGRRNTREVRAHENLAGSYGKILDDDLCWSQSATGERPHLFPSITSIRSSGLASYRSVTSAL
jgi:hypothetical protein